MGNSKKVTLSTSKELLWSALGAVAIAIFFFYKFFLEGLIPFPGDLLIGEYKPWRTYSIAGYNPGSYPHKAQYPDTIRQLYPWKTQVLESLRSGNIPLWNPHNFGGSPLLANFQSAALYPLNVLYFLLSQPVAWAILVILQPLLVSFFTYWYARTIGISPIGSTLAAISFAYGSFMTVWLEYNTIGHVIIWLPLALLSIERMKDKFHPLWFTALIGGLTLCWFGGHPQIAAYIYIFTLIYIAIRISGKLKAPLLLGSAILPLGLGAVQILPGLELLSLSARSVHPYGFLIDKILIQPWQLIMLMFPDFFGNPATRTYWPEDTYIGKALSIGLVPLFFLFAVKRATHPLKRVLLVTSVAIAILVTKNPVTLLLYRFPIPLISTSSPTLLIFLFQFCLSVLCGIGIDWFIQESHTEKKLMKRSILVIGVLLLSFLIIWLLKRFTPFSAFPIEQGYKSLVYALAISITTLGLFFAGIRKKSLMIPAMVMLLCVQSLDLFYGFQKFNPFVPASFIYPETKIVSFVKERAGTDRIWGYGTASIDANIATQLGLYSPDGYDPLYPKWYGEFIHMSTGQSLDSSFTTQTRSDAVVAPGFGEHEFAQNTSRLLVLNRLGVRYILDRFENNSTATTFPASAFTKIYDSDGWFVYESLRALPKAMLASSYKIAGTPTDFEQQYRSPSFDPSQEVILESPPTIEPSGDNQDSIVQINDYLPNKIMLTTSAQSPKILVLQDTYYPGWVARIDGAITPVLKANYAMRAISVPAGNHSIEFIFEPASFTRGAWTSGFFLLLFALTVLIMYKRYGYYAHS